MKNIYDDAVGILLEEGWTKINPASFKKGQIEIFFDTSNYVEVYRLKDKKRIYESHLESIEIINHILNTFQPDTPVKLDCKCEINMETPGSGISGKGDDFRSPKYKIESRDQNLLIVKIYSSLASGIRYKECSAQTINNQLNLFSTTVSSDTIEFELRAWELVYKIKTNENINFNKIFFNNDIVGNSEIEGPKSNDHFSPTPL